MTVHKQQFKHGVFYQGDVRELIDTLPNQSVGLILTDPPYGLGFGPYDNPEIFYSIESELHRVATANAWLVFYWSIRKLAEPMIRLKYFHFCWQLVVTHHSSFTKSLIGDRRYLSVLIFAKGKPKVYRRGPDIIQSFELPQVEGEINNPLFKPTGATLQLIARFSTDGITILDPFAGLGTIPFVAEFVGRPWIACEIDKEWFDVACGFIKQGKIVPTLASIQSRLKAEQLRLEM